MNIIKQWPVFFLLLAFAIAPLFHGIETGILVAIHIIVLAVFIKALFASKKILRIPYNGLPLCICLFYIWMSLSISWSPSPAISLSMFVWLSIFPICFFIYSIKQPGDWSYLPVGILVVTMIFAFIGIGQVFISHTESTSLFATRNTHAALINLIVLPVMSYFINPKHSNHRLFILWGIILFLLFFAVFQTGSKGATLSLLFGLVFITVFSWKYIEKLSLLTVIIILITAFLFVYIKTDESVVNRFHYAVTYRSDPSISERILMWQSAWEIIKTSPVIGVGIGTYYIFEGSARHIENTSAGFFAHNDYLQFWVETGFIGLSLMLLIMVTISMLFIGALQYKNITIKDRLEIIGLMAALCTVAIHAFVDFNFYIMSILMIMGFMCARIQEISIKYSPKLMRVFIPTHNSRKLFILATVVFPLVLLSYSVPVAIADYYMQKANEQLRIKQVEKATFTLRKAALWNPGSIRIRVNQFSLFRSILIINKNDALPIARKAYLARALSALNEIEGINPLEPFVYEGRGHLLVENSDIVVDNWHEKAVHEFKKALQLQPRRYGSRIALARLLAKDEYLNEAVGLMNRGINYYYHDDHPGLNEFYQYAVKLNLMNGDTIKAREIQIKKGLLLDKQ